MKGRGWLPIVQEEGGKEVSVRKRGGSETYYKCWELT